MFNKKQQSIFNTPVQGVNNSFVNTALQNSNKTLSGNGALKYKSSGNDFVDQFSNLSIYRKPRSFEEISKDTLLLWSQNKLLCVMFIFFIRMISRITSLWDGSRTNDVQKGAGLKHEGIMRMIWLHINAPQTFWKNIKIYISIASWRDIFDMLRIDLEYNGWDNRKLDWNKFSNLILAGLENPKTSELVKKYMPQIQSRSKCKTLRSQANTSIGKWLSHEIFGKYDSKQYRLLKSNGKAHEWQQLISKQLFNKINFDSVHGRALLLMVSGKFLKNNNLENKYQEWIILKPVAKFTGYVHELSTKIQANMKPYLKETINKQFNGLVETAKHNVNIKTGLIVVRDTSGSMGNLATGTNMSAYNIAKAISIFFSEMLQGSFKNAWIEFNKDAKLHVYKGDNFVDKWLNDHSSVVGNTNFMSVCTLFCNLKRQDIDESQFPTGILCISDGEFDPTQFGNNCTNVKAFKLQLQNAGFSQEYCNNFQIILWNIPNNHYSKPIVKFETFGDAKNVFYLSGYDPSILGFLLGSSNNDKKVPTTPEELFKAAMDQQILNSIEI